MSTVIKNISNEFGIEANNIEELTYSLMNMEGSKSKVANLISNTEDLLIRCETELKDLDNEFKNKLEEILSKRNSANEDRIINVKKYREYKDILVNYDESQLDLFEKRMGKEIVSLKNENREKYNIDKKQIEDADSERETLFKEIDNRQNEIFKEYISLLEKKDICDKIIEKLPDTKIDQNDNNLSEKMEEEMHEIFPVTEEETKTNNDDIKETEISNVEELNNEQSNIIKDDNIEVIDVPTVQENADAVSNDISPLDNNKVEQKVDEISIDEKPIFDDDMTVLEKMDLDGKTEKEEKPKKEHKSFKGLFGKKKKKEKKSEKPKEEIKTEEPKEEIKTEEPKEEVEIIDIPMEETTEEQKKEDTSTISESEKNNDNLDIFKDTHFIDRVDYTPENLYPELASFYNDVRYGNGPINEIKKTI